MWARLRRSDKASCYRYEADMSADARAIAKTLPFLGGLRRLYPDRLEHTAPESLRTTSHEIIFVSIIQLRSLAEYQFFAHSGRVGARPPPVFAMVK